MNENENEKKKNSWLPIVGGIALIIVLFIVVKMIFAMLAQVVPPERLNPEAFASQSQSQSQEQPAGDGQADPGARVLPLLRGGDDRQLPVGAVLSILWRKGGAVT